MLPGFTPRYETRAKVRCGIKVNGYPRSVDYFVCDDAEFAAVCGDQPASLRIVLPYNTAAECWSTNLELWARSVSACYSDDAVTAHRKTEDGWTLKPTAPRVQVPCRGESCPDFVRKDGCKMTGRLYFFLAAGDRRDQVLQLDTHARGTISQIGAVMQTLSWQEPLAGRELELAVRMEKKGDKKFPVVTLAIPQDTPSRDADAREQLIALLRELGRDPKSPAVVQWVKDKGIPGALEALRKVARDGG